MAQLRSFHYTIAPQDQGRTVFDYLLREKGFSRRIIIGLKRSPVGMLRNGEHVRTVDLLSAGDLLTINLEDRAEEREEQLSTVSVPILYEDEDVLVFDKPAGMPCHQAKNHQTDTLANVYATYCREKGINQPFRAVNRLDRNTSGIVVTAKNHYASAKLNGQVDKWYLALAEGFFPRQEGTLELPIRRLNERSTIRIVSPDGQYARTDFQVLHKNSEYVFLRIHLETGRTHQIRVHFSYIGHPLAGDDLYGGGFSLISRQALHCERVRFLHPVNGKEIVLNSPLHQDMQKALELAGLNQT